MIEEILGKSMIIEAMLFIRTVSNMKKMTAQQTSEDSKFKY